MVTYPHADRQARRRAIELVHDLRAREYPVAAPIPVAGFQQPGISYFFAADAFGAAELAQLLAMQWPEAAVIRLAPAPRQRHPTPGTIRVALPPASSAR
jgi:hypothetical protein